MHWGWARSETCETVDRLLSNAVKYSLQSTETLCLTRPRRELVISVRDQGGGHCSPRSKSESSSASTSVVSLKRLNNKATRVIPAKAEIQKVRTVDSVSNTE